MCLNPIYKNYRIVNGKYEIGWRSTGLVHDVSERAIALPCNNCPECWTKHSTEWAVRCYNESKQHKENCIITLTYENTEGELCKRDYQLFLKRLRKAISPTKIKYFISGEYGSLRGRPHFHLIVFGWCPKDCTFIKASSKGTRLYDSAFVREKWTHGFVTVDPSVSFESCFYSAKYMQKAVSMFGEKHIQPPFIAMSKGIDVANADKFDPFNHDFVYVNGKKYSPPKYYLKRFLRRFGQWILKDYREHRAKRRAKYDITNPPLYIISQSKEVFVLKEARERSNLAKWNRFYKKVGLKSYIRS